MTELQETLKALGYSKEIVDKFYTQERKSLGLSEEQEKDICEKVAKYDFRTFNRTCTGYPLK